MKCDNTEAPIKYRGLVIKQALRTYSCIPSEHKRWIGLDDVVQDGYLAMLVSEAKFKPNGAKESTFVWKGITFHYNHEYIGKLHLQKRKSVTMVELDAPTERSDGELVRSKLLQKAQVATYGDPEEDVAAVKAVVTLCRELDYGAVIWLFGTVLLSGQDWKKMMPMSGERSDRWLQEVHEKVEQLRLDKRNFDRLVQSQEAIKMALTIVARNSSIGLGTERDARVLECITCHGRFALASIRSGAYIPDTLTCRTCYRDMQRMDPMVSCFGKPKTEVTEGYSDQDAECTLHCQDRKVCKKFAEDKEMAVKKATKPKKDADQLELTENGTEKKGKTAKGATPAPKQTAKAETKPEKTAKRKEEAPAPVTAKASKKTKQEAAGETQPDTTLAAPKPVRPAKAEAKPVKEAKAAKPAKATTNGKEKETEEYPAPKEVVRWPHKKGSWMQYCFQSAYRGISKADLEKQTTDSGRKWPIFLKVLQGGKSGMKRPTHTWRLDESGGRLKIHDVKYVGGSE